MNLLKKSPCCPWIVTLTSSNPFHQCGGRPLESIDAVAGPAAAPVGLASTHARLDVPHGSVVSTTGPGRGGGNVDLMVDGAIDVREETSRVGAGRLFC